MKGILWVNKVDELKLAYRGSASENPGINVRSSLSILRVCLTNLPFPKCIARLWRCSCYTKLSRRATLSLYGRWNFYLGFMYNLTHFLVLPISCFLQSMRHITTVFHCTNSGCQLRRAPMHHHKIFIISLYIQVLKKP